MTLLRRNNPTWDYRFYDDEAAKELISSVFDGKLLPYYARIDDEYGAAKADFFRYVALYCYGGVYLDIKCESRRPLDDVIRSTDRYLLSYWNSGDDSEFAGWGHHRDLADLAKGEFQQWFIVSVAGHPFLKAVIEMVCHNIDNYIAGLHGVGRIGALRVTGPIAYTRAIHHLLERYEHRIVDSESDLGLEYSVYGRNKGHEDHMATHYSRSRRPVASMKQGNGRLSVVFEFLRAIKEALESSTKKDSARNRPPG